MNGKILMELAISSFIKFFQNKNKALWEHSKQTLFAITDFP